MSDPKSRIGRPGPTNGAALDTPISIEWKASVRRAMVEQSVTASDLARKIGVTRAAISHLLRQGIKTSNRQAIEEALGLPLSEPSIPRGPKEGPAWPASDDWKHAVMVALDERGWNQSDLARELAPDVATTPAAISYMLTKAKQTSLRPFVDKLLGLAPHAATMPAAAPNGDPALLAELLNAWASLTPANRARLVERASALLEGQ